MAQRALGEVKPASTTTALRATNNQAVPTKAFPCQALQFQALDTNTGAVFICDRETPSLTANVHVKLPIPAAGPPAVVPAWSTGNPGGAAPLDAKDYWILPAVSGEGVRITAVTT